MKGNPRFRSLHGNVTEVPPQDRSQATAPALCTSSDLQGRFRTCCTPNILLLTLLPTRNTFSHRKERYGWQLDSTAHTSRFHLPYNSAFQSERTTAPTCFERDVYSAHFTDKETTSTGATEIRALRRQRRRPLGRTPKCCRQQARAAARRTGGRPRTWKPVNY